MKRLGFLCILLAIILIVSCASGGSGNKSAAPSGKTGSASASAQGFGGQITVTVNVEKGKITGVNFEAPGETPAIGGRALDMAAATMVEKNSVEIDATAGATVSTKALILAAKEAFSKIQ